MKSIRWKGILIYALLLLAALSFRVSLARFLPNDEPNDGKVYAQLARNLIERQVYSHATEPPYEPSLIRLPGYPLFLAAIYSTFGHDSNTAVRMVQAALDTVTCGLIAATAFLWEPDEERKRNTSIWALALAALCPFSAIYVATILTESPTIFLAAAMCLTATLAFSAKSAQISTSFWVLTGLIGGVAVLFRPDSGLFVVAIGLTLVTTTLFGRQERAKGCRLRYIGRRLPGVLCLVFVFSAAFCLVLAPWTIRNARVFHLFQPLAPAHAEMPGEFVPRGYLAWVRTWLDDERYVGPVLWSLDEAPLRIDEFPDRAFDSPAEKATVAALLEKYNHPPDTQETSQPGPNTTPASSGSLLTDESHTADSSDTLEPNGRAKESDPTTADEDYESDEDNEGDENNSGAEAAAPDEQNVEMTPEIDAGFAQLARTRIARAPIRYYLRLPLTRAMNLWFDTHSQYYPFAGELLPLANLDHDIHQQFWLPLFTGLTWLYTLLGITAGWILWRSRQFAARRWLMLAALLTLLRLSFFATLENPEPRYVVEIFPFLAMLGGITMSRIGGLLRFRL